MEYIKYELWVRSLPGSGAGTGLCKDMTLFDEALVACLGHLMSKYGHKLCPLLNMPKTDTRSSKNIHKPSRIIHIVHTAGQRSSTPLLCELQAPQARKKCR